MESVNRLSNEQELLSLALCLGAREVRCWSAQEEKLVRNVPTVPNDLVEDIGVQILSGRDPLGEALCRIRSPESRRMTGAIFTPERIVQWMLQWSGSGQRVPHRVVDPGAGSARFLIAAGRRFPAAELVGIELDPVVAIIARGNLAAAGLAQQACIQVEDYRKTSLNRIDGATLFIGNPPYVRHHSIAKKWKQWLTDTANRLNLKASRLAGLHVHFFLATALMVRPGDFGAFVTAAEWLDVNYGSVLRKLMLDGFGGRSIILLEPTAEPFPDAATTAAITTFEVGSPPTALTLRRAKTIQALGDLSRGMKVPRERLEIETRWTQFTRPTKKAPAGFVELGELFRVHRGQVTGANDLWIAGPHSSGLPESVLFKSITRAREVFEANGILSDISRLRAVIDIPPDLDLLANPDKHSVLRFLRSVKEMGAHSSYIARNRKAWWSVGLREPAAIIATYMARRSPAFALNKAGARHINIAHGLYVRARLSPKALESLVRYLLDSDFGALSRTYAGGLMKFEPREMERIMIPPPEMLERGIVTG